jgi:fatty acid synthase subunit alpha, fungi type
MLQEEVQYRTSEGAAPAEDDVQSRIVFIEQEALRQEKDALATFGMLEGSDARIAPLRRALAVWGMTADDIGTYCLAGSLYAFKRYFVGVISIHGTGTAANVRWHALVTT